MRRNAFISALTFFALSVPFSVAFAQVPQCSPTCGPTETCVAQGNTTSCAPANANGNVDEITVVAASSHSSASLRDIVNNYIIPIGNDIVILLFAFAFLFFIYGAFKYFFAKGSDPKAYEDGRSFVLWSLIAFVVLFGLWGLIHLLLGILPAS